MKISDEQLSAYLDNALTLEERAVVDRALAESVDLRKELSHLRQLGTFLKEIPTPEPSEQFYRRVLAKTKPHPRAWLQWTVPLVGAAAAAMVMIFIAGEKKESIRQSLGRTKSPVRMSKPTAERAKSFDSLEIVDAQIMRQVRQESLSGIDKKMQNEAAPKMYSDEISRERKKIIPTFAESMGADSSIKDGENIKHKSLGKEERRGIAKGDKAARYMVEVPSIEHSEKNALPLSASNIQIAPSSSKQRFEPGLAEVPPAPRLRADKPSPRRAPASEQAMSIPDEALLPTEWQGDSSGITTPREIVIKDAETWAKLWVEHQSILGTPSPAPIVNFKKFMIVGIFLGERGSSGYSVQLTDIKEVEKELIVSYQETPPFSGGMQLSVMTQPYHLRAIPRTLLPIRFKKN